jgi:anaerobic magnesium-protoporphyrin IX monomethyl ester cyclase
LRILFVLYDNESRNAIMPLGITYVAAYARQQGHEVEFYCQDVYHYPEAHLTQYLNENHFDVAAMGFCAGYYQHIKIKKICEAIRASKDAPFIVLGGHGPSPDPNYWIEHTGADAVVIGEGEISFADLLNYPQKGGFRTSEPTDLDALPFPYIDPLPMENYIKSTYLTNPLDRGIGMVSGRGCPYHCNFCYRLEDGIRFRSAGNIVEEIQKRKRDWGINFVWFWDELWMASEKRAFEISEAFLEADLNIHFFCTGRLNIVNERIMKIMKRAGCVAIDYGIEQFDNKALAAMRKNLTEEQIERGIQITQAEGIQPLFNIIWGNVGDTIESLNKSMAFLEKYNDYGQLRVIRPVTPYPGSPLFDHCVKNGLLKDSADFYEKHKNLELMTVNMTDIPDDSFYACIFDANKKIIRDYHNHEIDAGIKQFRKVYFEGDYTYRGARH